MHVQVLDAQSPAGSEQTLVGRRRASGERAGLGGLPPAPSPPPSPLSDPARIIGADLCSLYLQQVINHQPKDGVEDPDPGEEGLLQARFVQETVCTSTSATDTSRVRHGGAS